MPPRTRWRTAVAPAATATRCRLRFPNAIQAAVAEHAEFADSDHVLENLDPPFLHWARSVKNMELNDYEGALYPTRR